jgi:L-alanine-DL-glutamate epimerase-like enolase superfamily enzyme
MGDKAFMKEQISEKLEQGFRCIKLKIGAIDFETELDLLKNIRSEFSSKEVELRVDANGAFSPEEALEKLSRLAELELHSIEQPIKPGQWEEMAKLCEKTPLPIALDEELIGVFEREKKQWLLKTIKPQYIILKPALVGGFSGSEEWISEAEQNQTGWWATSALESNIGLNAIAQWVYTKKTSMPQGLGTGKLFTNNILSPLFMEGEKLGYEVGKAWGNGFLGFSYFLLPI